MKTIVYSCLILIAFQIIAGILVVLMPNQAVKIFGDNPILARLFGIITWHLPLFVLGICLVVHLLI